MLNFLSFTFDCFGFSEKLIIFNPLIILKWPWCSESDGNVSELFSIFYVKLRNEFAYVLKIYPMSKLITFFGFLLSEIAEHYCISTLTYSMSFKCQQLKQYQKINGLHRIMLVWKIIAFPSIKIFRIIDIFKSLKSTS